MTLTLAYALGVVVAQEIPNLLAWVRFLQGVPNSKQRKEVQW